MVRIFHTIESARKEFASRGMVLLSTEYKNSHTKMSYRCSCGKISQITMSNLKQGNRCKECKATRASDRMIVYTEDAVKSIVKERGDRFLQYEGYHERFIVVCGKCGERRETTFASYLNHRDGRCCAFKHLTGENSPHYKDISLEDRERQRNYPEYREWVASVYRRDDYTCRKCGERGGKLQAHHIKGYAEHIELRTVLSNGATLCNKCHSEFHSKFGLKKFTEHDFQTFIEEELI